LPASRHGCVLAGAVCFSCLLCPSSPVFLWSGSRFLSHCMGAVSSEAFPPPPQPWRRGEVSEGMSLEAALRICEADERAVSLTLPLLALNPRREYQFSASTGAGAGVLPQPRLRSLHLKQLGGFWRRSCSRNPSPLDGC